MAVDLNETNINPSDPKYRGMLENLQGNILKPHGRRESDHLFLRFTGDRSAVRAWIRRFASEEATSAREQLADSDAHRERGARGRLVASLHLSATGYEALGLDTGVFGEPGRSFRNGMKRRAIALVARNRDPPASEWEKPYRRDIHALVTLADDSVDVLAAKTRQVSENVRGIALVLANERGTVLRNGKGEPIEHFGYVDARSQPLFLKGDVDRERGDGIDRWDPSAPLGLVLVDDPHADGEDSFGSYLVFRKLEQDVTGFNTAVRALASRLAVGEPLAGALVVGRFKDGTPVAVRATDGLGAANNFEYLRDDGAGNRCPFHAHIRKANQRGANRGLGTEEERRRRIVRRGVPYGVRPAPPVEPHSGTVEEKGLLFMCFQADIGRQFEFIQRTWVDNPNFPEFLLIPGLNTGDDALIGQHPRAFQRWPREWGKGGRFLGRRPFNFGGHVRLRGGEYFFTPSLSFLKNL
jgi:Dyp-type peroxidase family